MLVKLNAGRAVRDPVKGGLLPETATEVPDNAFWRRRLRDADVAAVTAAAVNDVKTTDAETPLAKAGK